MSAVNAVQIHFQEGLDDEDEDVGCKKKYKKSQCTFPELRCWYEEFAQNSESGKPYLVIIIPEIETISLGTLHGFLDLMRWLSSFNRSRSALKEGHFRYH